MKINIKWCGFLLIFLSPFALATTIPECLKQAGVRAKELCKNDPLLSMIPGYCEDKAGKIYTDLASQIQANPECLKELSSDLNKKPTVQNSFKKMCKDGSSADISSGFASFIVFLLPHSTSKACHNVSIQNGDQE